MIGGLLNAVSFKGIDKPISYNIQRIPLQNETYEMKIESESTDLRVAGTIVPLVTPQIEVKVKGKLNGRSIEKKFTKDLDLSEMSI